MNLIKTSIFIFFVFFVTTKSFSEIIIKYKIDGEIITNIDILNEKNYLTFLRPDLKNISGDELLKISENSLIREIIKKKELDLIFKNKENDKFIEDLKKNLFTFKGVKNEKEFKILIKEYNIEYDNIIKKIKYESLWNEFIYKKYSTYVKIDKDGLRKQLKSKISKNKKYEYNISEILFEIENNENLNNKYKLITRYINLNNFKTAASRFSISNSSIKGGEIGWVKETLLSSEINSILKNLKINEPSKPIKYPNGYLILNINDKREMKQVIDINKELDDMVNFETNKQLNQFSLLYYKKLKQNTVINEY